MISNVYIVRNFVNETLPCHREFDQSIRCHNTIVRGLACNYLYNVALISERRRKNDELTIAEAYCCRLISAGNENEAKGVFLKVVLDENDIKSELQLH